MSEGKQKTQGQPHIALFISALRKGGSERVLVNLADFLQKHGFKVTLVTQYKWEEEYPLPNGVNRILSDITPEETGKSRVRNLYRRISKLRGIWKTEKPDVILSFIGKNNLMALFTSAFLNIPVVVSVRGEPAEEYYSKPMRLLAKHLFAKSAGVVLQTSSAMDFFPEKVRKKAVILKNPLNPDFVRAPFEGERDKTIVAVGRVDKNKNHEMLMRAFAGLAQDYPEYELIVYGEGEERKRLVELSEQLGLAERISLPGAVSQVADTIYRAGIFVLASYSEGMPNTLIEAMCMGLPAISTDCPCGGPGELIKDGVNGLLIPPGDTRGLENALRKLLSDDALRSQIGKNAAELLNEYEPEQVGRDWMEYLEGRM